MQEHVSAQIGRAAEGPSLLSGSPRETRWGGVGWAGLAGAAYSEARTVWGKLPEFQGLHF